ncbi:MAG TPA: TetR/AcrR family transcriptional regulator [Ktedonosporobacter sp.]|nr:TetR/AcrR family transcriptional regulator [Ktedonosporobacter sp.]
MSHPTRQLLINAGLDLASNVSLNRISIDAVVNKAGVAKGTFYVHFHDRAAFLVALHVQFHEQVLSRILEATEGLPHGAKRLRLGTETYLNECLQQRAIKAILLEARSEPSIASEVQRRNATFAALERDDFAALGWSDPATAARLFVALGAEVALIELETGQNEAARQTLWRFARLEE